MRRLVTRAIGIEQGSTLLFSDFEHNGLMWTGKGTRECRQPVRFAEEFRTPPVVHIGISMWDMDQNTNQRADISAERINCKGFEIVFRTWGDSRVARIRADWTALGEVYDDDDWRID